MAHGDTWYLPQSILFAKWWTIQIAEHPEERREIKIRCAINARRIMSNDLSWLTADTPGKLLPDLIWFPAVAHYLTYGKLAHMRPDMFITCLRACIVANDPMTRMIYCVLRLTSSSPPATPASQKIPKIPSCSGCPNMLTTGCGVKQLPHQTNISNKASQQLYLTPLKSSKLRTTTATGGGTTTLRATFTSHIGPLLSGSMTPFNRDPMKVHIMEWGAG
ncbi:hypothetical protein N7465_002143 [Penicillium sp. CMV-2018d]|nr:hypothetical protein N7465_002143 [Penicillium sp. CMV-2018d]